jgi:hypothetical protein
MNMSRKGAIGRLILPDVLGFLRSVDLESWSVTTGKAISMDYNRYPDWLYIFYICRYELAYLCDYVRLRETGTML